MTDLPCQPLGAIGVLDIRGKIVQVYDLQRMLGSHGRSDGAGQVVLVVSLKTQDVGLLVDTVSDIVFAKEGELRELPDREQEGQVSFMVKIEDRLIGILNLGSLFPAESGWQN